MAIESEKWIREGEVDASKSEQGGLDRQSFL